MQTFRIREVLELAAGHAVGVVEVVDLDTGRDLIFAGLSQALCDRYAIFDCLCGSVTEGGEESMCGVT